MESGIFAIIGVVVGAVLTKLDKMNFKSGFTRKVKQNKNENENEELTMAKQWENLLNYDGRGN